MTALSWYRLLVIKNKGKEAILVLGMVGACLGAGRVPSVSVYDDVIIEHTADGVVIIKYDNKNEAYSIKPRANVSYWGRWDYTGVALSRGVVAGAVNTAYYAGVGSVVGIFGIPAWAINGLLVGVGWTSFGSTPGNAVANLWDRNRNGWVGFYTSWGYDAAGRIVASRYTTW